MNAMDIIKRIIADNGHCGSWAKKNTVCKVCPLSKLSMKIDGTFLSCFEAVGAINLSEEEADMKYKEAATRVLLDAQIDDIIRDTDGTK